jgi:hypothetical protein
MNELLVLPAGPLADASLAIARASESQAILDHSIRSFLFARLLADHEGCLNDAGYDEDLLFAATVMHDLGLGEHASGELVSRSRAPIWLLPSSGSTALPNPTSTEFGRRSHCTRLSASPTGAVC